MDKSSTSEFLIAAIGASAGGIEAYETFFTHMPADSGIAFAVVMHLAPDHESALTQLLARHTRMTVEQVRDNTEVVPNRVYIIPPNATLTIEDRILRVTTPAEPRGHRTPIDSLFRSLAEDCGEYAVCIMLSGTGTDGTLGLKAIKEHGGTALVQTIESAKYDGILRSAIATGLVDHVLPVEEMPAKLLEYAAHLSLNGKHDSIREQLDTHWGKVHALLRRNAGHDFSQYKESTFVRRLERRMKALQMETVEQYVDVLERQPEEAERLFNDLLIGVTHFFRDAEAFEALGREVIPNLFEGKEAGSQVRACVVGCASGEEAYSIAILLCEYAATLKSAPKIQLFATDIDERGLDTARKGRYPEGIAQHVSPERLERFFIKLEGAYQIKRELRDICVFSNHSFIKDPPFTRLDLISCRNVMIYLAADLQQKMLPLFHYALRAGGYLFLGPSESVTSTRDLFGTIDNKHRIFQRKESLPRPVVQFPLADLSRRLPGGKEPAPAERNLSKQLERIILQRYRPACVTVKENGDAVYFSGPLSTYLEQPTGSPDTNVLNMAREGLRIPLRSALHRAATARERIVQTQVAIQAAGAARRVDITVEPLPEFPYANLYMITFEEAAPAPPHPTQGAAAAEPGAEETIRQLESELRAAREGAQSAFEELETTNEELQSSNEEFQSTNEELESSKEELQSFNEELETLNNELSRKVAELDHANSDLQNLLGSTQIATIFLDTQFRIKTFTPAAGALFRLIPGDAGRPITDLAARFADADLEKDIQEVLSRLSTRERQLAAADGRHYQMRVMPYRTVHDVIDGVVITFMEVTQLKMAQQQAQDAKTYAENIVDTVREPLLVLDAGLHVKSASKAFYEKFQVSAKETLTKAFYDLGDGEWNIPQLRHLLGELLPENKTIDDFRVEHDFPKIGKRTMLLNARQIDQQGGNEPLILLAIEDATKAEERYRILFESAPVGVFFCDTSAVIQDYNRRAEELWGRAPKRGDPNEKFCGSFKIYLPDGTRLPHAASPIVDVLRTGIPATNVEVSIERPGGSHIPVRVNYFPLRNESGDITGAITSFDDITERKAAEEAVLRRTAQFETLLNEAPLGVYLIDGDFRIREVNPTALPFFGNIRDVIGRDLAEVLKTLAPKPYADEVVERFRHTLETGEPYVVFERIGERLDLGDRRYYDWQISRIPLPDGRYGVVCYFRDVSRQVLAREVIAESAERLRFMAESMPQKIFTAKPNGDVDYFNRQWSEFTGLSFEQIRDWGWTQFIHPEDVEENIRVWKQSIDTGEPFEFVHRFRRADGLYRWHLSRARAMRNAAGQISMWIGSNTDIHDEKETEAELRRLNENLNQFAFAASHDFQEPLRMITSYSQLLLKGYRGQLDGEASLCVDFITEGTQRMRELLADLLAFTEAGSDGEAAADPVDLNLIFQKVTQDLKEAVEESRAVVTSDPLPAIRGQQAHFVQLFQNLIVNAIKYRGERAPLVHVSAEKQKTEWLFCVTDNGMGIPLEYHQTIFGVFKRLHGKKIPGTGIGLAICQRVVERLGGRIWVESQPEQGAKFCFTLPLVERGNE